MILEAMCFLDALLMSLASFTNLIIFTYTMTFGNYLK